MDTIDPNGYLDDLDTKTKIKKFSTIGLADPMNKKGVKLAMAAIKKDKFEKWDPSYKKKKKPKKEEYVDPLAPKEPEKTPEELEEEERKKKEKEEKEAKKKSKKKKKKAVKKKVPPGHKPTRFIPDKDLIRKMVKIIMKFGHEDEETLWKKIAF